MKDRKNFNDEFDEETIDRIVLVDGFNKEVSRNESFEFFIATKLDIFFFLFQSTTREELVNFFKMFKGTSAIRKRVFRFGYEPDADWHFTGSVFVTFDTRDNADR